MSGTSVVGTTDCMRALPNLGSTCYLNAVVQAMTGLQRPPRNLPQGDDGRLVREFFDFVRVERTATLRGVANQVRRRLGAGQQDAHDLWTLLADAEQQISSGNAATCAATNATAPHQPRSAYAARLLRSVTGLAASYRSNSASLSVSHACALASDHALPLLSSKADHS